MKHVDAGAAAPNPRPGRDVSGRDPSETVSVPDGTSTDAPAPGHAAAANAWVGKALGKCRVTGVLGRGAMGVVLKAYDPLIERDVAIKVLADHLAADPTALARFLAEAKA